VAKRPVLATIKLHVPGGQATPAPPVGPALGQRGVNIGEFVKRFNDRTKDMQGMIVPCVITVYRNRSFDFITKSPPASSLLKRAAGLAKGSGEPNRDKVGKVTRGQLVEIAKTKEEDLNAQDVDAAVRIIEGTARSMGIEIEDQEGEAGDGSA